MSTSDKKALRCCAGIYLAAAAFCIALSTIYRHFSHGVDSEFMLLMFVYPLAGAVVAYLLTLLWAVPYPDRISRNLWGSGISTLAVGSCLRGIFDIYGTRVPMVKLYWIVGGVFSVAAMLLYMKQLLRPAVAAGTMENTEKKA